MNRRWLLASATAAVAVTAVAALPALAILAVGSATAGASGCPSDTISAYTVAAASLDAEQQANAATIIGVGSAMVGVPGEIIGVATSMVEASLHNLPYGDRDSLGLFQQRASQGWGTPAQELDPAQASTMFYTALLKVPGWQTMDPGMAAQAVQRSAFPDRYDTKIGEAHAIVAGAQPGRSSNACLTVASVGGLPSAAVAELAQAPLQVQIAVSFAAAQLGKPYLWGGTGPGAWDCSGLTEAAYAAAGVGITRTTYTQVGQGSDVTGGPYQPGDLLFPEAGHVELYIGGGYAIQAPHTGTVVQVSPAPPVWQARRVVTV